MNGKEGVEYIYSRILLRMKYAPCSNMDGPRDIHISEARQTEKDKQRISFTCGISKKDINEFIYKTEID